MGPLRSLQRRHWVGEGEEKEQLDSKCAAT